MDSKVSFQDTIFYQPSFDGSRVDLDFYWLGKFPCRTFKLVGTVVGIDDYEARRIYTGSFVTACIENISRPAPPVDDGSAIIGCIHRPPPLTPSRKRSRPDEYPKLTPPLPPPVCSVGQSVIAIGTAKKHYQLKRIVLEQICMINYLNKNSTLIVNSTLQFDQR